MTFVSLTKEQFEQWATKKFPTWAWMRVKNGSELVIVTTVPNAPTTARVELHIYSTLSEGASNVRGVGEDAIRIVLFDVKAGKPIAGTKKVLRTESATTVWERIESRITELLNEHFRPTKFCLRCGSHLVERINGKTKEKFWGCGAYPLCGNIVETAKKYPFVTELIEEEKPEPAKEIKKEPTDEIKTNYTSVTQLAEDNELIPTSEFPYAQFPFPYFNRVQSTIMREGYWAKDCNLVLGTTTSSGKTVAAELFMNYTLTEGKRVVYVSPLKSLTQEKYEEWGERYKKYPICILTGDYILTEAKAKELNEAKIVCLTSEMIDSRTRNHQSEKSAWMFEVGLVIVDESHIISTNRGHAVEVGLMRFTKLVPSARVLCLSATMPNVEQFQKWLTGLNNKPTAVVNSDWRPTKLNWHLVPHLVNGSYYEIQDDKKQKALALVLAKPTEKFLIFAHDKNTGRQILTMLKHEKIESYFHNADLSLEERLEIEGKFADRDNGIRVLVSTSTLAWGRTLPARNVIILGVHRGLNDVDQLDVIQMAGRAGRSYPPRYVIQTPNAKEYVQSSLDRLSLAIFETNEVLEGEPNRIEILT
jgi:superfamily II helicase